MRIVVIINSNSNHSRKKDLESVVKRKFSKYLESIERTYTSKEATAIVRGAVGEGIDTIVAVGGDGTVNGILNGIAGTEVALGVIPMGTANDLASWCKIPNDVSQACDVILGRHIRRVDLISVNGRYYVTNGGLGLSCEVVRLANEIKQKKIIGRLLQYVLGSRVYVLTALLMLMKGKDQHHSLTITCNGNSTTIDCSFLMVNNQSFLGKNFLMSPCARNDDGLFDVCQVHNIPRKLELIRLLIGVLHGTHDRLPYVRTWQARELSITMETPQHFFGDGEIFEEASEFKAAVLPRALSVIVPKHSINKITEKSVRS